MRNNDIILLGAAGGAALLLAKILGGQSGQIPTAPGYVGSSERLPFNSFQAGINNLSETGHDLLQSTAETGYNLLQSTAAAIIPRTTIEGAPAFRSGEAEDKYINELLAAKFGEHSSIPVSMFAGGLSGKVEGGYGSTAEIAAYERMKATPPGEIVGSWGFTSAYRGGEGGVPIPGFDLGTVINRGINLPTPQVVIATTGAATTPQASLTAAEVPVDLSGYAVDAYSYQGDYAPVVESRDYHSSYYEYY